MVLSAQYNGLPETRGAAHYLPLGSSVSHPNKDEFYDSRVHLLLEGISRGTGTSVERDASNVDNTIVNTEPRELFPGRQCLDED